MTRLFTPLMILAAMLGFALPAAAQDSPQISMGFIDDMNVSVGTPVEINASFVNRGSDTSIDSFDFTLLIDDEESEHHVDVPNTDPDYVVAVSGTSCTFSFTLPAFEEPGDHYVELTVKKLNGREITVNRGSAKTFFNLSVKSKGFRRTMLVEEYTGVWCGYCTSGWVAVEAMHRIFPDDMVAIVYHSNDIMTSDVAYPEYVSALPYMRLNREKLVTVSSVEKSINAALQQDARAKIEVSAEWATSEGVGINVSSTVTTLDPVAADQYRIAYGVVHDDMRGTGRDWLQSDNGLRSEPDYPEWNHLGGYLWYNDVMFEGTDMKGLEGSVPALAANAEYSHQHFFDMKQHKRPAVQNKKNLEVVALLVDKNNVVVNAARTEITADPTWPLDGKFGTDPTDSVADIDADCGEARYFSLDGVEVGVNPGPGVYVKRCGEKVTKVVVK